MAIRNIRLDGDPILRKRSREVEEITDRELVLLDDMEETMRYANGVGLAAPQVGVLRRIIVVDDGNGLIEMINPEISDRKGRKLDIEGCLSVPGRNGYVDRPAEIKVNYLDRDGKEKEIIAKDLLARIICHEVDHLNGILYTDIMKEEVFFNEVGEEDWE